MHDAGSDDWQPDLLAAEAGIDVVEDECPAWPLALSAHSFVASMGTGPERIQGFGCGPTIEGARRAAIAECVERYAQFGCTAQGVRVATGASLGEDAISPEALGLYGDDQYIDPQFPFARYSDREPLEWVELAALKSRQPRYLPAEFVYPRASMARKPLVAETSNGTAAHGSRNAALLAGLCELIERDSLLMFWHRQPPTRILSLDSGVSSLAAGDLELIRGMGFVVVVCLLQFDLGIPCVLALALRGNRFASGAGCHPCMNNALEHALREIGSCLRWQLPKGGQPRYWISLEEVRKPADHYALYDGGPFHDLLRQALANTIRTPERSASQGTAKTMPDDEALDMVVRSLGDRGYHVYEVDLTPGAIRPYGLSVTRAFVPGLIPMYFGFGHMRLGCRRLWSRESPGRLCTLLPHFIL
jgi:ribosomal protein S12 methylthiotransferase accessory factor